MKKKIIPKLFIAVLLVAFSVNKQSSAQESINLYDDSDIVKNITYLLDDEPISLEEVRREIDKTIISTYIEFNPRYSIIKFGEKYRNGISLFTKAENYD